MSNSISSITYQVDSKDGKERSWERSNWGSPPIFLPPLIATSPRRGGHKFDPWSVQKDPTSKGQLGACFGTTEPVLLKPQSCNYRAHAPQLLNPVCLEPALCSERSHCKKPVHCNREPPHSPQLEKACTQKRRPSTALNNRLTAGPDEALLSSPAMPSTVCTASGQPYRSEPSGRGESTKWL
ncbi:hypothetical protein MJG53_014765 [Ovis ammon polii x Ovis aries]|uniref:Uncharacterized protein n=1 Tax=Ovis ammon polii x Ovis aries TaxID=2918886 RepID=A0ACB9UDA2_9CETA|nr:hypothetical protein MJG53_014765 [Ovis ammon polii x Ovis aries]